MTRSIFLRTVFTIGAAIPFLCSSGSGAARWEYVGEANMDGGSDHDSIKVGASQGSFRRIQLLVQNAAIEFDHVEVHFTNGSSHPVPIKDRIPAGGKSREIELPGEKSA